MKKKTPPYFCQELFDYTAHYGNLTRLAKLVNVSLPVMSLWRHGHRRVPIGRCIQLCRATDGYVQPKNLRPDFNWMTE